MCHGIFSFWFIDTDWLGYVYMNQIIHSSRIDGSIGLKTRFAFTQGTLAIFQDQIVV